MRLLWMLAALGLVEVAGSGAATPLGAQDAGPPLASRDSIPADSTPAPAVSARPPLAPLGALWRSFLVPGWGQARLGRRLTGGLFVAWEGVTLGMSLKASHELRYLRRVNSPLQDTKRKERQDWLVLLAFNHLFSGLEAYVSAHLWDFPADLQIQAMPGGGVGGGVSIPVHLP